VCPVFRIALTSHRCPTMRSWRFRRASRAGRACRLAGSCSLPLLAPSSRSWASQPGCFSASGVAAIPGSAARFLRCSCDFAVACDRVVFVRVYEVPSRAAGRLVASRAAGEFVVSGAADELVVPRAAVERVSARPSAEHIVVSTAVEGVVPGWSVRRRGGLRAIGGSSTCMSGTTSRLSTSYCRTWTCPVRQ
jgi:hypothetical protein